MSQGKVKWYNTDKGFGFIAPSDGSPDVFVHRNNIVGLQFGEGLREEEEVEYEVERTPKGLSAINVEQVGG
jgi:cold shock protein